MLTVLSLRSTTSSLSLRLCAFAFQIFSRFRGWGKFETQRRKDAKRTEGRCCPHSRELGEFSDRFTPSSRNPYVVYRRMREDVGRAGWLDFVQFLDKVDHLIALFASLRLCVSTFSRFRYPGKFETQRRKGAKRTEDHSLAGIRQNSYK